MLITTEPYSFRCATAGNATLPPVLFLHGFMGSGDDWRRVMDALAQEFYCIAPDLPGHGNTIAHGGEELYNMEHTARGLAALLHELSIAQCMIVGYSMGGRLALYLTAKNIFPVRATVLESSSPGLRTEEERSARRRHDEGLAHRLETTPLDDFLVWWYDQPLFASLKRHADFDEVLQRRRKNDPAGLALSLRRLGTGVQPSLWNDLSDINTPLVLLAGKHDTKFVGLGREMDALLPNSELHVIEGAGHTIHVENEPRYIDLLRSVLRRYGTAEPSNVYQSEN